MSKKRKRKFMLSIVLVLLVKSSKANGDLFAEGFMLNPLPQKTPKCRPYRSYGPKLLPIWRRGPKTMLSANKNSGIRICRIIVQNSIVNFFITNFKQNSSMHLDLV